MSGLTPAQVAVRDQALAHVRDISSTMPVLFIDLAQGETCCWCDCPTNAPDHVECSGCTEPADAVLRIVPAPEQRDHWPVCKAHRDDAFRIAQIFTASLAVPG